MIQKRIAFTGLSKQTVKGTGIATATYGFGLTDGSVMGVDIDQPAEETTSDVRVNPGANRVGLVPGSEFTSRLYPRMAGLLLYGALGNIATTGPVGAVYTHTLTPGDDLPWLTLLGRMGAEYYRIIDSKIDELTISFDGPGPVEVSASLLGITPDFLAGAFTTTNTDNDANTGKFRGASGTFQLDIDSGTPATAPISAGEISISNNLEAVMLANAILPNDIFPGVQNLGVSLTVKPENLLQWREIITGTAAGTVVSDIPIYGSFNIKFALDANTDVTFTSTRVAFTADFPDVDPSGGPQELELTGEVFKPSGAALTTVLRNTVVSY